ncbi:A/G-specific adenine glycosylase [Sphingomonas oligoaromativorans]|uniref:A/G-specific adenine glycosylase n=1 Tax=Sphingomonas oligoaromativorans TaxID=575322 RepID=UPI0014249580|nr:A/G-specific adenine glycosylase [Sphingomonas oligoaromativorans]NIJ34843.1 A/G-specific adenine glycosylase [Sphingomonas oligoaromativorans]
MPVDAAHALLAWYDAHARALPWRAPPGTSAPDPYRVWLSEIMLQQTTVAAVGPYFAKFTRAWPTVADLAAADEAELMAAWAGLGYYARARNLIACARAVMADHGGRFPDSEEGLRALPGIGAYTAAAIAAIAFGRRAVVVDANVERVVTRLFACGEPLPNARPRIRELTDSITPDARAGDFAQAMMDLGATVCTVRNPRCGSCPLGAGCEARAEGNAEAYPVKPPRKAKPRRKGIAYWLESDGAVLLVRRPGKGMLGGMRALPGGAWGDAADATPPLDADWRPIGTVEHVFTHFALSLDVMATHLPGRPIEGEWWPVDRIGEAGLPTLYARAATLGRASQEMLAL